MNKLHLQHEYAQKVERNSSYRVTFSTSNLRISLIDKDGFSNEIISRALIVDNSLQLEPMETYGKLGKLEKQDFLLVMGYWVAYANMKNLSTVYLIPKTNKNEHVMKTWDDPKLTRIQDFLNTAPLLSSDSSCPSLSVEKITTMFDLLISAQETMQTMEKRDITFSYSPYGLQNPFSFSCYFLRWKGTNNEFHLTLRNGDFYLEWNDKPYLLTLNNISTLLAGIFEEITDTVRFKNLFHPPVDYLAELMESNIGTTSFNSDVKTEELAEKIMNELIHLGCSNEEIEAESCRMILESSVGINLPPSSLRYREKTFCFFDTYFVSVIFEEEDDQYTYVVTDKKEDVFSFYVKRHEKTLAQYLPGFQKSTM